MLFEKYLGLQLKKRIARSYLRIYYTFLVYSAVRMQNFKKVKIYSKFLNSYTKLF